MKKVKHQAMRILGLVASIIILVVLLPILGGCTDTGEKSETKAQTVNKVDKFSTWSAKYTNANFH